MRRQHMPFPSRVPIGYGGTKTFFAREKNRPGSTALAAARQPHRRRHVSRGLARGSKPSNGSRPVHLRSTKRGPLSSTLLVHGLLSRPTAHGNFGSQKQGIGDDPRHRSCLFPGLLAPSTGTDIRQRDTLASATSFAATPGPPIPARHDARRAGRREAGPHLSSRAVW